MKLPQGQYGLAVPSIIYTNLPNGIYGYHSHFTSFGSISLALITSRGTFTFFSAKVVVGNAISFIQKQRPLLFPFLTHSRHINPPFRLKIKKPQERYLPPCFCHFSEQKSGKNPFLSLSKNHTRYLYQPVVMYEIVGFGVTKNIVFLRCFLRSNRLLIICVKLEVVYMLQVIKNSFSSVLSMFSD